MNPFAFLGRGIPPEVLKILRAVAEVAEAGAELLGELRELREECRRAEERHGVPAELTEAFAVELAGGELDAAGVDAAARRLALGIRAEGVAGTVQRYAGDKAPAVLGRYLLHAASGVEAEGARNVLAVLAALGGAGK